MYPNPFHPLLPVPLHTRVLPFASYVKLRANPPLLPKGSLPSLRTSGTIRFLQSASYQVTLSALAPSTLAPASTTSAWHPDAPGPGGGPLSGFVRTAPSGRTTAPSF